MSTGTMNNDATINNNTIKEDMIMQGTTTMQSPAPIVRESDFPKQSSHLQELLGRYRAEQQLPATPAIMQPETRPNLLANVEIVNDTETNRFESLSEEDKIRVLSRIDGINYMKALDIQMFGSAKQSSMSKHADIIISKYSASEAGELSDPITDLVATLRSHNPKDIVGKVSVDPDKEWGFFSSFIEMLSMKNARKKMFKTLAEHESIQKNLKVIEVELQKQQLSLQKDMITYQEMSEATREQIREFELDCIALQLMKEDAESKLNALISKGKLNQLEASDANDLQMAIDRISRKMYTIQTIRIATIQSIPQIAVLLRGDEIICEKISEVSSLVIPLWSWQYAIAIGALKQKEALNIQKTIRGITSKLLTGNAKLLHDNMIAAQEELYAAAVAIEDLLIVQDYIDDMVTKVNESRKNASQKCVEGIKTMKQIEQKNHTLMSQNINN